MRTVSARLWTELKCCGWLNVLLSGLILLAPLMWALRLGQDELWHDETYSLCTASGLSVEDPGLPDRFRHADVTRQATWRNTLSACVVNDGGNAPLHALLMHAWMKTAPATVRMLRAPSWVLACLVLVVVLLATRDLFGSTQTALLATALTAWNPLLRGASMELRFYPLALLMVLVSAWLLLRAIQHRTTGWHFVALAIASSAAILSHYSTVYILAPLGVVAFSRCRSLKCRISLIGAASVTAFALAIWLENGGWNGLAVLGQRNREFIDAVQADPRINTYFQAARLRTMIEGVAVQSLWASGNGLQFAGLQLRWLVLMLALPGVLLLHCASMDRREPNGLLRNMMVLLSFSSMAYAGLLALQSGHTVSFMPRYALFSMPFWCIAMAVGIRSGKRFGRSAGAAVLAIALTTFAWQASGQNDTVIGPNQYRARSDEALAVILSQDDCPQELLFRTWNAALLFNLVEWRTELDEIAQRVDHSMPHFLECAPQPPCDGEATTIWPRDGAYPRSEPRDPMDQPTPPAIK
ncbi:MAG: glycosyltransferase family 39 protein [Flavobacteriales bacterium]|nr:glycosyltransferase family 39 protein [Flavobacteriales bacterium]